MRKLISPALVGLLLAIPAVVHAQPEAHPQSGDEAKHDHSAPPPGTTAPRSEAMPPPMMEMGKHMEDCCCPCCKMMQQHGGKAKSDEGSAPKVAPEQHQH